MDKKEFEENYIFEKYKDTAFRNCKHFRKSVEKYINIDISKVYAKIINYQIKTYGETLTGGKDSYQDKRYVNQKAYGRNKSRRKIRGTWKSATEKRWQDYE
jgi:hypothetical protein